MILIKLLFFNQKFVKLLILPIRLTGSASLWLIPERPISIWWFFGWFLARCFSMLLFIPHTIFSNSFSRSFDSWNWLRKKSFSALILSFSLMKVLIHFPVSSIEFQPVVSNPLMLIQQVQHWNINSFHRKHKHWGIFQSSLTWHLVYVPRISTKW